MSELIDHNHKNELDKMKLVLSENKKLRIELEQMKAQLAQAEQTLQDILHIKNPASWR